MAAGGPATQVTRLDNSPSGIKWSPDGWYISFTMLMTGVKDLRTPISQTEEFYQALKVQKVPTAMLRFNDEYHGTSSKPSNYIRSGLYLHHWFEKYMK